MGFYSTSGAFDLYGCSGTMIILSSRTLVVYFDVGEESYYIHAG